MQLSTSALKVWEILQPQDKKRFYLILLLNLISMMLETFSIALVFPLMVSLLQPELLSNHPLIKPFLEAYSPFRGRNFIVFISAMLAFFFMLKNVFSVFLIWMQSKATAQIHLNLTGTLLKYYLNLPYLLHVKRNTATLLRNLNEQSQNIITFFVQPVILLSSSLVIMLGIIVFLLITDLFSLVIISLSLSCSSYFFLKLVKKKLISVGSIQAKAWKIKNLAVLQSLSGFKETKVLSKEKFFWSQFYESSKVFNQSNVLGSALSHSLRFFIEFMVVATVLFIIILLLLQGEQTENLVIKIAVFSAAALKLLPLVVQCTNSFSMFYSGMASIDIIYKDIKEFSKYDKNLYKKTARQILFFKKNIRLKRVSFSYANSEKGLFENLSLTIEKNKWIAFVGPSGSGKTTLVDLLLGLLSPTKGEILIDDKKRKHEGELWGKGIGYVSQSIYLLDNSIKENIAFGEPKEKIDTKRVWEVLETAQLAEFVRGLPKQLDNIIGENGITLSGGQKQRLGIARALYHRPSLLVLDEATSALDNQTEQQFIAAMRALKKSQLTVLMIAHRLTTIKDCDIIYCLFEGKLVGKGSYEALKASNKPFQAMLNAR